MAATVAMMVVRGFNLARGLGNSIDRVSFVAVWMSGRRVFVTLGKRGLADGTVEVKRVCALRDRHTRER